jgi:hypothetical protein
MRADEEETMDEDEIDVDAELADADEHEKEIDVEEETSDEDIDVEEEVVAETEEDDVEDDEVDEDGLTYEPEDGDEVTAEENETVVSAVDSDEVDDSDDEPEEKEVVGNTKESRISSMADKKKTSISDHVRAEIEKRKSAGASLRGVDIVAALEKRGVTVSPAQVSQLLKKAGLGGSKRGRKPAATTTAEPSEKSRAAMAAKKKPAAPETKSRVITSKKPAVVETRIAPKAARATNGFNVPMDQLAAASKFIDACGGSFESAKRILNAAEQLSSAFGG